MPSDRSQRRAGHRNGDGSCSDVAVAADGKRLFREDRRVCSDALGQFARFGSLKAAKPLDA
jgi:hypothetical protein